MNSAKDRLVRTRGMTLITALAFTLVVGTILAGVATVSVSHFTRSKVEADYSTAVSLAEAGINYEIAWVSFDITDTGRAHQSGSAYVGSVPGVDGNFSVYVEDYNTGGTWVPPNDMRVIGTGTVRGISRRVEIRGIRKSLFDEYAIYAIAEGTFSGGGSGSESTQIIGNLGTNGTTTWNGSQNTEIVDGEVHLNGGDASTSDDGANVVESPDPVVFPTVTQIANSAFPGGLSWLATNNDNAGIRMVRSTDTAIAGEPNIADFTAADVTTKLAPAGFTAASRTLANPPNTVPSPTSSLDAAGGARFAFAGDSTYGAPAEGIQGKRTYFLPPGDYYFNNIDFRAGNNAIVFLTHLTEAVGTPYANKKQLRIWINQGTPNTQDHLSSVMIFTDPTPSKFRLYYNKCNTLNMNGSSRFSGGVYAVKNGCTTETPNLDIGGNSVIYGSMITQYFDIAGGSVVVFPNNGGGASPDDFPLWYGFKDRWREIATTGSPIFVDGSSD